MFKTLLLASACAAASAAVTNPMIKLNNGVMMPQMAAGTWQYDNATAQSAVTLALDKAGFTHIDTAENYYNQIGVGKALAGRDRSSYFLTTKTVPCDKSVIGTPGACFKQTLADVETDLKLLGVDYVDLILLHGPARAKAGYGKGTCDPVACASDAEQWAAYEQIYKAGKAKAIGVSNYCQSCLDSLLSNATVVPAVNQVMVHVGMGDDPNKIISYCESKGIVVQAYSPLANGKLPADTDLAAIGKIYGKSAAQVALKWLADKGIAVTTKANKAEYLSEDIDLFGWNLTHTQTEILSANTKYAGQPSWACTA